MFYLVELGMKPILWIVVRDGDDEARRNNP
jgi:hypothetical protein